MLNFITIERTTNYLKIEATEKQVEKLIVKYNTKKIVIIIYKNQYLIVRENL